MKIALMETTGEFELHSPYVERFWTPVVGPTAMLVARAAPQTPLEVEGGWFGVSDSKLTQAAKRLEVFGFAMLTGHGELLVKSHVGRLTPRMRNRLPDGLAELHARLVAAKLRRAS